MSAIVIEPGVRDGLPVERCFRGVYGQGIHHRKVPGFRGLAGLRESLDWRVNFVAVNVHLVILQRTTRPSEARMDSLGQAPVSLVRNPPRERNRTATARVAVIPYTVQKR